MTEYPIRHITDIANIADADVPEFVASLLGLIASLKLTKAQCELEGLSLVDALPIVMFVPALGDKIVIRSNNAVVEFSGKTAQAAYSNGLASHSGDTMSGASMELTPTQAAHVAKICPEHRAQMTDYLMRNVAVGIGPQNECGNDVPPIAIWVVERSDFWIDCCNTTEEAKAMALSLGLRVVHVSAPCG